MIIADVDSTPGNEIVTAYWGPAFGVPITGRLVAHHFDGVDWSVEVIDNTVGIVDGLDVGDFDGDEYVDLIVADGGRVRYYEHVGGVWRRRNVTDGFLSTIIRDVELDDPDNDGCNEILVAVGSTLVVYEFGSTVAASTHAFPTTIDSVQVADIDFDGAEAPVSIDLPRGDRRVLPFSIAVAPMTPAGSEWELIFEATARVPSDSGTSRRVTARSAPVRVRIAR